MIALHVMPTCLMVTCLHKYPELKSRMKMMEQTKKNLMKMTSQEAKKGPKKSSSPFDLFRFLTGDEKVFIRPHLRCFLNFCAKTTDV